MSVSATTTSVSYTGDGSVTSFAVTFAFQGTGSASELTVVERTIATGVEVTKSYTSHYTVTGGSGSTGTVIAASAPASTVQWHIRRNTTTTQTTDYVTNDPFAANTIETDFDRLAMTGQERDSDIAQALRFPDTYTGGASTAFPEPVANAYVLFNTAGDALTTSTTSAVQHLGSDGTALLPFYSFTSDPNIGMWRVGADQLGWSVNGVKGLDLSTTGLTVTGTLAATTITGSGVITGTTIEATGDTSSGDNSALGYTSALGAILTGQGSTNDITLVNDADATVLAIPTGTTNVDIVGVATAATFEPDGATSASDNAAIGYDSTNGITVTGQGSTNDVVLRNDAAAIALEVPTGTQNVNMLGNLVLTGDLTVNGTTVTVDATNIEIKDPLLELNSGATSNANDLGLLMERGSTGDNIFVGWDESGDYFGVGTTTATADTTGNITYSLAQARFAGLNLSGTSADLGAVTTIDINGGTVDGAVIGGAAAAAATFTDLASTGDTTVGNATGDAFTINPAAWTLANAVTVTGTWANLGAVTTADINGGTIDGTVIGGAAAAAISGTTISGSTSLALATGATVTGIDNGAVSTGSATLLATQGAIQTAITATTKAPGVQMTWESNTADSDQGAGKVWANHSSLASASVLFFDDVENNGVSINALIDSLDDPTSPNSAVIYIQEAGTSTAGVVFKVSGDVVSASTYSKVSVTHQATFGTLVDGDTVGCIFAFSGDAGSSVSTATTSAEGKVELATSAETITGTDTARVVTPSGLQAKVASATAKGIAELATTAETITGTDTARVVTPAGLHGALAGLTDATVTVSDTVIFSDATDSNALKEDTVQGIIDLVPDAAAATKGIVELATTAESITGTDTARAITPAGLHGALAGLTDTTITAADTIIFADATDSQALKEDTVQGIIDLAGGAGWEFVEKVTASTSSTIELGEGNIDAGYDYIIVCRNCQHSTDLTVAQAINLQYGTSTGPTYQTTGYVQNRARFLTDAIGLTNEISTGLFLPANGNLGGAAGELWGSETIIYDPAANTVHMAVTTAWFRGNTNLPGTNINTGSRSTAEVITGFRIKAGTGTITSGDFMLYKRANA